MIKLALFDLGETILDGLTPFPDAVVALDAISRLHTAEGAKLALGLVSDFKPVDPPGTEAEILAKEAEYRKILEEAGLDGLFQPFALKVTLSTRAGVNKPDRRIFELAIARSGIQAKLSECAFTTEDIGHLEKCAEFGMTAIRFGSGPGIQPAFSRWADAPALFSSLIGPGDPGNHAVVTSAELSTKHGLLGFASSSPAKGGTARGQARRLVELKDPRLGDLSGIYAELPTDVTLQFGSDRRVAKVSATPPDKDEVADAVSYVASLSKSGKIALPGRQTLGATHAIEQDPDGKRRLVRKRFSAF